MLISIGHRSRLIIITVAGLIVLATIAGGFYYFTSNKSKKVSDLAKKGQSLVAEAKYNEAIPICEEVLKADPKNIVATECLMKSYDILRDSNQLENLSRNFIEQHPKKINGYIYLSHSYEMQGRFKEAEQWAQKAIELFPKNSKGYNRLGHIYDRQGHLDLAKKYYDLAVKINPKNAAAHQNLGRVYTRLGQYEEAKKEYELAKQYSPAKGYIAMESRLNLGFIAYQYENDLNKAIKYFEEAMQVDPNVAVVYVDLGRSYYKLGKVDEAIALYRKAMGLDDQLSRPYIDLAEIYLREGKSVDEAIQFLENAENRLPLDHSISKTNTNYPANINYFLAAAYAKKNDFDKAFEYLKKAFRYDKKTLLGELTPAVKINKEVGKNAFTDPLFSELRKDERFWRLTSPNINQKPTL